VLITRKEADDLIAVLGLLEVFAGEQACARIGDREIADLPAMRCSSFSSRRKCSTIRSCAAEIVHEAPDVPEPRHHGPRRRSNPEELAVCRPQPSFALCDRSTEAAV